MVKINLTSQQPPEIARYVLAAADKAGVSISEYVLRTLLRTACADLGATPPELTKYDERAQRDADLELAQLFGCDVKVVSEWRRISPDHLAQMADAAYKLKGVK